MSATKTILTQKGVFMVDKNNRKLFTDVSVPPIPDNDILVKVAAVSVNPVDWKLAAYGMAVPDSGCGCDFSGTVIAIGANVTGFEIGEQVYSVNSGYQLANKNLLGTAYAEYVFADPALTVKSALSYHPPLKGTQDLIKAGKVTSFEAAASIPLAALTAALSLSHFFKGQIEFLPDGSIKSKDSNASSKYILIWGGATSVGQYGIQIAKAAGYKVVTTASPKNFEYLASLGVEKIFDYHQADVSEKIKEHVGSNLVHVFDTVSVQDSWKLSYQSIPEAVKNINMVSTLPFTELDVGPKHVEVNMLQEYVFIPSQNRIALSQEPKNDGQRQYITAAQFTKCITARINSGKFFHNPVRIFEKTGVENIEEAVEYFRNANVSAYKFIVKF